MPGLPSFKNFLEGLKQDPKGTVMYVAFLAIVVLFGILQAGNKRNSVRQDRELAECRTSAAASSYACKVENDQVREKLINVMGALKELKGEMKQLKRLGIIKE